jgi:deferrochelatase/peroxidase EfeB
VSGGLDRRSFLSGVVGSGLAAPLALEAGRAKASAFPFEGKHQQGILTPPQKSAVFLSFDVTAADRAELTDLMRAITERARFLSTGGVPTSGGLAAPPSDSGTLGSRVVSDGLTITASIGSSLFDGRYGLAARKPAKLRPMEDFANDALRREACDGDLLLQICADNIDTVLHAVRDIARATRGGMQVRWRQDGFVSPPRPTGTPRNHMGFKDGTSNPDVSSAAEMDQLVWASADEPAWAAGGTYHVVRVIRMLVEFWDRINLTEQERMIGRRRDSGAPLTRSKEFDDPEYTTSDPSGDVIPMSAHIRKANDRSQGQLATRILRRAYNYDAGTDPNGNLDMGLVFVAFNRDLEKQFVAIQRRLADEPLVDYISPFGGGYFYALPGVRDSDDWLGRGLLM